MAKWISTPVEEEMNKEYARPVELFQIYLDTTTMYLAMYPEDIDFYDENGDSVTYEAANIARTSKKADGQMSVDRLDIKIQNIDLGMSGVVGNHELRGKKVVIWKVFLDKLDSYDNYIPVFSGRIDDVGLNEKILTASVISLFKMLDRKVPRRKYSPSCEWTFGDSGCGYDVPEDSGTVDSVDENKRVIGSEDLAEYDDRYWDYGNIHFGENTRAVLNFWVEDGVGYVEVDIPVASEYMVGDGVYEGDSFDIEAGCDYTLLEEGADSDYAERHHGCSFWDNEDKFGGFRNIPESRDIGGS